MRKATVLFAAVMLVATAAHAENIGSMFGSQTTARSMAPGHTMLGASLGVADATSVIGAFGFGFSRTGDGRLRAGFIDDELIQTTLALGADAKWQLLNVYQVNSEGVSTRSTAPFDLALGPFIEWYKIDFDNNLILESQTVFQAGAAFHGSYPVQLKNGGSISPYGRINARIEWLSIDMAPSLLGPSNASDNQLALGFNGGVAWHPRASPVVLFGEFQLDGNDGVFFGINYLL